MPVCRCALTACFLCISQVVRSLLSLRRSTHQGFLLSFLLHVCVFYFQYLLCHAVCLGDLLNICMSCWSCKCSGYGCGFFIYVGLFCELPPWHLLKIVLSGDNHSWQWFLLWMGYWCRYTTKGRSASLCTSGAHTLAMVQDWLPGGIRCASSMVACRGCWWAAGGGCSRSIYLTTENELQNICRT